MSNFHSLEVVGPGGKTQLQVGEMYTYTRNPIFKWYEFCYII